MVELYRQLEKYRDMDYYPFHMPGHKRNAEAAYGALAESYGLDITEIDGFDNLHQAQGILREEQERAARLYGAGKSYYLVNGSTCGILSAIFAVTERGDRILMARNCHKAVYHAVYLRELEAVYIQPDALSERSRQSRRDAENGVVGEDGAVEQIKETKEEDFGFAGAIAPEMVERALQENSDVAAVVITSPTYEGVVSDVKRIAGIVHAHGIPLIVDEAHGAHLGFHEAYPANSVSTGADLVIHSVHKTLPAMTQAALLHWNENQDKSRNEKLVDRRRLERYLRVFQTSSPSYVLMASVSSCMDVVEKEGWERLERLLKCRHGFMERIRVCRYVKVFQGERKEKCPTVRYDPCKLVISVAGDRMTGQELYDVLLKRYHLQMEMAADNYVLAIVTMMDTKKGWERLADALVQIDNEMKRSEENWMTDICQTDYGYIWRRAKWGNPEAVITIAQAYDREQEEIELTYSKGRIAAEFINVYPPGIPLVVPGERVTGEIVEAILHYSRFRSRIQGIENGLVRVIKE